MMRSFIVAGASRPALTEGGLRKTRVAPTRPLRPGATQERGAPTRLLSRGTSRGQALDEREESGPADAEAVACFATLAGATAERRGFLGIVKQPLDRAGERGHVPGLDHEAAAVQDLGNHRDRRRDDGTGERH